MTGCIKRRWARTITAATARRAERWMKHTGDQAHVVENPTVFEYWDNIAQQCHGKRLK